jgi:amino acid adenylation domain-containing protein
MSLLPLIEDQVRVRPEAVAVAHGEYRVTYRELADQARRIAQTLRQEGIQPGSLVAVYLNRSPQLLAALIAIWQAGAAYLPLDPTHPSERTAFMAEDSGAAFVLSETDLLASVPRTRAKVLDLSASVAGSLGVAPAHWASPSADSLAYVIYTSGSTGRPKGAMISHGSLTNTILGLQRDLQLQPHDVLLASNSVAFDISGQEFYLPLISGARVHLVERELTADGPRLMQVLRDAGITLMMGLSTSYRLLLAAGWQGDSNLQLTIGGETLSLELANLLAARSRVLWNHYGPTETSICATSERIQPGATRITLGRPLANVRVYVLDENQQPLPNGSAGEIYIGGAGVGLGYLNRPELTAQCFLPAPFDQRPGATMYKTGDFGTILEDGRIDFLGRADEQVKIRGFRIELGEVEAALHDCPGVRDAVARTLEFAADDKRLIAFLVSEQALDRDQLRAAMRLRLPHYMVPSEYIVLESFPLMPNGKVDRRALDALRLQNAIATVSETAAGGIEAKLRRIWQTLLRTRDVRYQDNFFDLGGHSLLAARMLAQVEKQFAVKIPVSVLAEHPTLEKLADYISHHAGRPTPMVLKLQQGGSRVPLFVAHGIGGSLLTFRELAASLGQDQPVYGLRIPSSLEEIGSWEDGIEIGPALIRRLAAKYVEQMRALVPSGPYQLAGHSSAGLVVAEVANQLRQMGCEVHLLALLDPDIRPGKGRDKPWKSWEACKGYLERTWAELKLAPNYGVRELVARRINHHKLQFQFWFVQRFRRFPRLYQTAFATEGCLAVALHTFRPDMYPGETVLFAGKDEPRNHNDPALGWAPYISGNFNIVTLPGGHHTIFEQPFVSALADHFRARLYPSVDMSPPGFPTPPLVRLAETMTATHEYIGANVD